MKLRLRAMAAATAATAFLGGIAACSGTASGPSDAASGASGATIPLLRAGLAFNLSTLDETKNISANNIDGLALETLVKFGPQGQVEPDLATSWEQSSPVTYVYHLRHGVKFWDGNPLTATDVAYSLNYDRAAGSDVAFAFTGVKTITATDTDTVTVTLTQPEANWKYIPAEENAYIFEKQFQQAHKATFGQPGTLVMGSGPWVIDSFDPTKGAADDGQPALVGRHGADQAHRVHLLLNRDQRGAGVPGRRDRPRPAGHRPEELRGHLGRDAADHPGLRHRVLWHERHRARVERRPRAARGRLRA